MRRRREPEVFGLSLMDLLCCGLGGMLILMLIISSLIRSHGKKERSSGADDGTALEIRGDSVIEVTCSGVMLDETTEGDVMLARRWIVPPEGSTRTSSSGYLMVVGASAGSEVRLRATATSSAARCVGRTIAPVEGHAEFMGSAAGGELTLRILSPAP